MGAEARPALLRRAAGDLDEAYRRAARLADRLDAARLQDARLEDQRESASAAMREVVDAMALVVAAARGGTAAEAEDAATGYATAVGALRSLPAS